MKIGIQFAGQLPREIADVWYKHLRKWMQHPIVHFTDLETEAFPFADEVQRIDEKDICVAKFKHLATVQGDCLNLDYDVVVQHDISDVFDKRFDVCLTKRSIDDDRRKFLHMMSPHNTGVIFTRNNDFWKTCLQRYLSYPPNQGWMLGQVCITEHAHVNRHKYRIREVPAALYNYTPKERDEDVSNRYVVHYKGQKKHWMCDTQAAFDEGYRVASMAMHPTFITEDHPYAKEIRQEKEKRDHR